MAITILTGNNSFSPNCAVFGNPPQCYGDTSSLLNAVASFQTSNGNDVWSISVVQDGSATYVYQCVHFGGSSCSNIVFGSFNFSPGAGITGLSPPNIGAWSPVRPTSRTYLTPPEVSHAPDLGLITTLVDWSTVVIAILLIAASLTLITFVNTSSRFVLSRIHRVFRRG